jgi:hypothetical protein
MEFLARSQDQIVDRRYRLGSVLHLSEEAVVRETEFGEDARPAAIRIQPGGTPDADKLLAKWRDAASLDHPHLVRIYAAGSFALEGAPVIYAVMERADESLAGVLAERPLSESEIREMLTPTLSALSWLHKKGYAHGSLKPSHILAVGDVLKLSAGTATKVDEGGRPEEDIRALGLTILQALRHEEVLPGESGASVLLEASEPLPEIVRHCLDPDPRKRWTADQLEARLEGRVAPAPDRPAVEPDVVPQSSVLQAPVSQDTVLQDSVVQDSARAPRNNSEARPLTGLEHRGEEAPASWNRTWLYGALAVLALIALVVGLGRKSADSGPAPASSALPAPSGVPKAAPAPPPAAAPEPPVRSHAEPTHASPPVAGRRGSGWSVVVASYGSRGPAEKRERELARRWPKFNVNLFEQHAGKTYYLVVVGQNLSEDEANAVRRRAIASGLPRDTYIRKFE